VVIVVAVVDGEVTEEEGEVEVMEVVDAEVEVMVEAGVKER
jgi:hypothetical protein